MNAALAEDPRETWFQLAGIALVMGGIILATLPAAMLRRLRRG